MLVPSLDAWQLLQSRRLSPERPWRSRIQRGGGVVRGQWGSGGSGGGEDRGAGNCASLRGSVGQTASHPGIGGDGGDA